MYNPAVITIDPRTGRIDINANDVPLSDVKDALHACIKIVDLHLAAVAAGKDEKVMHMNVSRIKTDN